MSEITFPEQRKRFYFSWVPEIIFRPRQGIQKITAASRPVWLTPLLILSVVVLVNVFVTGKLKIQAAQMGEITYPPDYQYYTPEQQAQYMQAIQSTQGPVFVYVLPALGALLGVWFGWLILGGVLHLVTTLFGGRGSTSITMNIVAWASLTFAVRAIVQILYMLIAHKMITTPGLSGFSPTSSEGVQVFIGQFFKLVDIYVIWQILLLVLGIRSSTKLSPIKALIGVTLSVLIIILLQSGFSYLGSIFSNLTITKPFFF